MRRGRAIGRILQRGLALVKLRCHNSRTDPIKGQVFQYFRVFQSLADDRLISFLHYFVSSSCVRGHFSLLPNGPKKNGAEPSSGISLIEWGFPEASLITCDCIL